MNSIRCPMREKEREQFCQEELMRTGKEKILDAKFTQCQIEDFDLWSQLQWNRNSFCLFWNFVHQQQRSPSKWMDALAHRHHLATISSRTKGREARRIWSESNCIHLIANATWRKGQSAVAWMKTRTASAEKVQGLARFVSLPNPIHFVYAFAVEQQCIWLEHFHPSPHQKTSLSYVRREWI